MEEVAALRTLVAELAGRDDFKNIEELKLAVGKLDKNASRGHVAIRVSRDTYNVLKASFVELAKKGVGIYVGDFEAGNPESSPERLFYIIRMGASIGINEKRELSEFEKFLSDFEIRNIREDQDLAILNMKLILQNRVIQALLNSELARREAAVSA